MRGRGSSAASTRRCRPGARPATPLIIELCGGEASEVSAAGTEPAWQRDATLRFERLAGLGGADVPPDEAVGSSNASASPCARAMRRR